MTAVALPTLTTAEVERYWAKVDKTETCWLWTAACSGGYGRFSVSRGKRRLSLLAHRIAYLLICGAVPDLLDHICRVRNCVNPDHLRPLTVEENVLAGASFSAVNARKTHCDQGHEFASENTYPMPSGGRECRACRAKSKPCPTCGQQIRQSNLARHVQKKHRQQKEVSP